MHLGDDLDKRLGFFFFNELSFGMCGGHPRVNQVMAMIISRHINK